jgi:hypothetical protein
VIGLWSLLYATDEARAAEARAAEAARPPLTAVHIGTAIHTRLEAHYIMEQIKAKGLLLVTPPRIVADPPYRLGVPHLVFHPTDGGVAWNLPINVTRPAIVAALLGFT